MCRDKERLKNTTEEYARKIEELEATKKNNEKEQVTQQL